MEDSVYMKAPWEYLEDLNEIVYVTETETNNLIYMNRYAMDKFSIDKREDYSEQKCYMVLQGRSEPCPFCNTFVPEEEEITEWGGSVPRHPFLLKDTLILWEGMKCRMKIAVDIKRDALSINSLLHCEALIDACLVQANAVSDPDESLNTMLQTAGEKLKCSRADIYEGRTAKQLAHNYSWISGKEDAEKKSGNAENSDSNLSDLWNWYRDACYGGSVLITDIDGFREENPGLAEKLESPNSHSIILVPLLSRMELHGFLRLDDPEVDSPMNVILMGRILSHFVVTLLERRDLQRHFEYLSYHDQLSNALNRHATRKYIEEKKLACPIGIVLCDINGLKVINDLQGHKGGDKVIIAVYDTLVSVFSAEEVFRVGGDEFLVLAHCDEESAFEIKLDLLQRKMMENNYSLSIGSVWVTDEEKDLYSLIKIADQKMIEEKEKFYASSNSLKGRLLSLKKNRLKEEEKLREGNAFFRFIKEYFFDADTFFRAVAPDVSQSFYFFGDVRRKVYYISDSLKKEFNFSDNLVYDFISILEQRIVKCDIKRYTEEKAHILAEKRDWNSSHFRIYNADGKPVWIQYQSIIKWNKKKTKPYFLAGTLTFSNNEELPAIDLSMKNLSFALDEIRKHSKGGQEQIFLCFSLNNFSIINQLLGREKGDSILWDIIIRIHQKLGHTFRIMRLEGVHFIIFSKQMEDPESIVNEVWSIVKDIYNQYQIPIIYPCSMGVLRSPRDGKTVQELVENASVLLNAAKEAKGKRFVEFSPEMAENYKYQSELDAALNRCINNSFEDFRIVIQPQVTAADGKIYGGETLLRWKFKGTDISPAQFIPALEKNGLINPVGKWVFTQAVHACKKIRTIFPDFQISVNVSYQQIIDGKFLDFIRKTLEYSGVPGENILLELTETYFNEMPEQFEAFVKACREMGLKFALDDFGTAYSSLQLLLQYPSDLVKLDRTMMREITLSKEKMNFIMSIIYACHKFGKKVCVEGVEKQEELEAVRRTDADFIQGFYFYQPQELEDLYQILHREKDAGMLYEKSKKEE